MIWLIGAAVLFVVFVWIGRQQRLGKLKTGPWFQQFRAFRGVISAGFMIAAVTQMARGAWPVGIVLALLALLLSTTVRFSGSSRPQPETAGSYTAEEIRAYQTLGLSVGADRRAVKDAWKRLMKSAHPDQGGDVKRASALNAARDVLLSRR